MLNDNEVQVELDSHADTCVVGSKALIVHDHERYVNVLGYDHKQRHKDARTVDAAIAYDDPFTGETSILMINQAIEIKEMKNILLCPMQCRLYGTKIEERPKFLTQNPTTNTHTIRVYDESDLAHALKIPLQIQGVTSYFTARKPTLAEYENPNIPKYNLTADNPPWDPADPQYEQRENAMVDFRGQIVSSVVTARGQVVDRMTVSSIVSAAYDAVDVTDNDNFGLALESNVNISLSKVTTTTRRPAVGAEDLAQRWSIPYDKARKTVQKTTQRGIRTIANPALSRRFRTNDRMLRYNRLMYPMFSDTLIAKTYSRRNNKYAQIFATDFGWSRVHPMQRKGEAHEALSLVFQREGVPPTMVVDGSKEQTLGDFRRKCREAGCHLKQTEPYSPWQNAAEREIRELKKGSGRKMLKTRTPRRLWDDCLELEAYVRSHTAHDIYKLDGEVPQTVMTGETADISQFAELAWYDWIKYRESTIEYPEERMSLGKYLGPAIDVGPAMTAKIMQPNGEIIYRSTYRPLTQEEWDSEEEKQRREEFMKVSLSKWGDDLKRHELTDVGFMDTPEYVPYYDEEQTPDTFPELENEEVTPEAGDNYVSAEVMLPRGNQLVRGVVQSRKRDSEGIPIGRSHENPILDTRLYEVRFPDGEVAELTANVIAQSMYAQCDVDGNEYLLLESLMDYRKTDEALELADQKAEHNGRTYMRKSTAGWQICCEWKDGSTSWEKLSDLKESHPVQMAEFAVAHDIAHEPAFNWWVPHVLKKRDAIISLVKKRNARYLKRTHKFGIAMPKTVKEALELDKVNGNTFWQDAIAKEMKNVKVAFDILGDGQDAPNGYQFVKCHMVFDVKMEDFRRKARLVAGGHMTDVPATITYASVVSRETVRIALTIAALNGLKVMAADVMNAYVQAPNKEKIWTTLGSEFGADAGKKAIIVRALYGLKSAGAAFRSHLADCMRQLGYTACLADPDLWLKVCTRDDLMGGMEKYYSYLLVYVDDILCIHDEPSTVLSKVDKYFPLKPGSVGSPDIYLGAKLKEMTLENGVSAWAFSPSKYVQESVKNCKSYIDKNLGPQYRLPKIAPNPFPTAYEPELDTTPELDPEEASYYQSLVGMMRWMVELGRIDICTELSLLSSHLALPREGHLEAALHVMSYLDKHHNSRLCMDPTYPEINSTQFPECDWSEFYYDAEEAIPTNAPEALGKPIDLRMFVDSDHAGDKKVRRSRSGFLIYLNNAPIQWYSKKQNTIETSTFGAEFVAMKTGVEVVRGIRYKLRMMGVPIDGATHIYGDNMSVIKNTSKPESTLQKKSNSVCYHAVRESVAMGESLTAHIPGTENPADLLTKVLVGLKRRYLVGNILYDIYDNNYDPVPTAE